MPEPKNSDAAFMTKAGERRVTREEIIEGMAKFDQTRAPGTPDTGQGRFIYENGKRYPPKWVLSLATGLPRGQFHSWDARKTLEALGFDLREVDDDDAPEGAKAEQEREAVRTTFGIERDLQVALRSHIDQLESGLKVVDGGTERTVQSGRIDITAEDRSGATVVIELKAGEADRDAIGQILAYMGDLQGKKTVRGILVAGSFSARAMAAARVVPGLQMKRYGIEFTFEPAGAS